jgi:hypothetical protein
LSKNGSEKGTALISRKRDISLSEFGQFVTMAAFFQSHEAKKFCGLPVVTALTCIEFVVLRDLRRCVDSLRD